MLELGRNRDCTGLFESYHVFADMAKLDKILARYELPESKNVSINFGPADNSTGLVFRDAFHEDVKQMAKDYFKQGQVSHKMKPWMLACVIVAIVAEIASAILMVKGYRVAIVLMPIFGWLLTGNASHDASHFALSSRPIVNAIFAYTSAPMCFNSTAWYIQHIVQHHVYTNDEPDVDLYHFLPVARTTRFSRYCPQFAFQAMSVFAVLPTSVCHLMFVVPLDLLTRYVDPVTHTRRYEQCENVDDLVEGAKVSMLIEFVLSLAWLLSLAAVHGFAKASKWLAMSYSIASFCFIVFTQGAHLQEDCMTDKDAADRSWAKRQVLTAVNFDPDSLFWSMASGGLNTQAIHHILPTVSACHLRGMYPRFREVCEKHGVDLKEASGIRAFFGGFLGWVAMLATDDHDRPASEIFAKAKSN